MTDTITRTHTNHRMSKLVQYPAASTTVITAGLVADDLDKDVAGQASEILATIDGYLAEAGTDKTRLISAYVWLADIADFDRVNAVWDAWVPANAGPVRACVEARLAHPRIRVEIQVTALK